MLYRKAQRDIIKWFNSTKEALLITGARQVGKSFLIEETLKQFNKNYVTFNFIEQPNLKTLFDSAIKNDADRFLLELEVAAQKKLDTDSVIFFDEIQECKEIVTVIKFLVLKGKYKYILSGSLLGVELKNVRSAPVGYLKIVDMYPMDFEEFLIANGMNDSLFSMLKGCFDKKEPISDFIHDKLIDQFYRYLIVGGMPEAVQKYITSQNLNEVTEIHKKIIRDYKLDFTKYEDLNKRLGLVHTYDIIPSQLDEKNKRYTFTRLNKELRFERYQDSFNWLIDAGVSIPTYNVTEFQIPLEASKKSNLFKFFLSDVGLLTTLYGSSTVLNLLDHGKNINCGAIFENFVAQELNTHGFKSYYFNNKKHGEVDFLIEYNNNLLPIEVKSGKDYHIHSALTFFMTTNYFDSSIVFSNANVASENNILYLPIYMVMFLQSSQSLPKVEKIDLSNL